jgi:predicted phage terminase large subunit-like protein
MRTAISADLAFKDSKSSDFVAIGAWGGVGANKYLLDLVWKRMGFTETLDVLAALAQKWPEAHAKYVEDAANGPAVIDSLQGKIHGVVAVKPEGGKESRAAATSPQVEAGNVYIPLHAEWRDRYIEEHANFPLGAHDDVVDQQSQLLLKWLWPTKAPPLSPEEERARFTEELQRAHRPLTPEEQRTRQQDEMARYARELENERRREERLGGVDGFGFGIGRRGEW